MKLTNDSSIGLISRNETEVVQKKEHEYKLIGQFIRTKGLRLYAYNSTEGKIIEIKPRLKDDISITYDEDGVLKAKEQSKEEIEVDARWDFFECLNMANAERRVDRFKSGKIKELCNLIDKKDVKPIVLW